MFDEHLTLEVLDLLSTNSSEKDFWLVGDSAYYNLIDPLQRNRHAYRIQESRAEVTNLSSVHENGFLYILSTDGEDFYTRKIERTTATDATGLVDLQKMSASKISQVVLTGTISVFTLANSDTSITSCVTFSVGPAFVSDIFRRQLGDTESSNRTSLDNYIC